METTDYVSYELAKMLEKRGFNEPCIAKWAVEPNSSPVLMRTTAFVFENSDCVGCDVCAPTLWQAQKWLREVHHISVRVNYLSNDKSWFADWLNLDSGEYDDADYAVATYEEALSAGIAAALELIL